MVQCQTMTLSLLWFPEKYLDRQWNHLTTTKGEMQLLQRLQNQLMRVLTNTRDTRTPTATLLEATQMLSVNQLTFVATATIANRAATTGNPRWLAQQLHQCQETRTGRGMLQVPGWRTSLNGECLAIKAVKAYNIIPEGLKGLPRDCFKRKVKKWAKATIPIKPP